MRFPHEALWVFKTIHLSFQETPKLCFITFENLWDFKASTRNGFQVKLYFLVKPAGTLREVLVLWISLGHEASLLPSEVRSTLGFQINSAGFLSQMLSDFQVKFEESFKWNPECFKWSLAWLQSEVLWTSKVSTLGLPGYDLWTSEYFTLRHVGLSRDGETNFRAKCLETVKWSP